MTRTAKSLDPMMCTATMDAQASVPQLLRAMAGTTGLFVLESSCNTSGYGRVSIVGAEPVAELQAGYNEDPFARLEAEIRDLPNIDAERLAFVGGWVGYIPYEKTTMRFALYDSAAIFDHESNTWTVCAVEFPQSRQPMTERIRVWKDRLSKAGTVPPGEIFEHEDVQPTHPASNMSRKEYFDKVERAIEYIRAGDIYQVNLTQRFTAQTTVDSLSLYLRLQQVNPSDYAGFLSDGDRAILCASPELFVQLDPDGSVITRPIKGTRARRGNEEQERRELFNSPKDRAELAMIVDLLRNDLGRVCEYGSIKVTHAAKIETHPTVHHLVGTIIGKSKPKVSRVDILRAMFPGGSITGCPKIRAMEIIEELEPTPRDVYCGSIGYISVNGSMTMNIAIRTMIHHGQDVHVYAGGAITGDSNPTDEFNEIMSKARGMFRALGIEVE